MGMSRHFLYISISWVNLRLHTQDCAGSAILDAQAYFSYDLDFAMNPKEWTLRNMMSDCVLQGPDSSKRTLVEIFNYEHKLGGQTVRVFIFIQSSNFFYPGVYEIPLRAVQGSRREVDFCSMQSDIMFLHVPSSGFPAKLRS